MSFTNGQIITFITVASCCLACYAADTVKSQQMGDSDYCTKKLNVLLAKQYIGIVGRYTVDGENNCLTEDELYTAMQHTNKILKICTDLTSLQETEI